MTAQAAALIGPYQGVLLALALGMLVGVERGWARRNDPDGSRVAGIRTFGLLGLLGGTAGQILQANGAVAALLLGAGAAIVIIGYVRSSASGQDLSATAAIVGILTLQIGLAAGMGQGVLAGLLAALTTLVLASRRQLHAWLATLSETEVQALARFALISLAILPILPDQAVGPFLAWNPRRIWLVVVFVCGISFAGYIAARRLGAAKGIVASAATGALVSSTAVTAAMAGRLRRRDAPAAVLGAAIAAASAVMFLRVLVLTQVLLPGVFPWLAGLIAPPAALAVIWGAWLLWRSRGDTSSTAPAAMRNPFELGPALVLAALVALFSVLARWVQQDFGQAGTGVVLAVSGLADVDSAIITMSVLPPESLDGRTAGMILAGPVMLNTIVKAVIAIAMGGRTGWRAGVPLLLSVATGGVTLPFLIWNLI